MKPDALSRQFLEREESASGPDTFLLSGCLIHLGSRGKGQGCCGGPTWAQLLSSRSPTISLSSGFHPQFNGQTERKNQELETALCCYMVSKHPLSWSQQLLWVK